MEIRKTKLAVFYSLLSLFSLFVFIIVIFDTGPFNSNKIIKKVEQGHMGGIGHQLHVFFFPFMAHGHTIPILDIAKLFTLRGAKTTIVATPLNASLLSKTIHRANNLGVEIDIQIINFPAIEFGLPEGCENIDSLTSQYMGMEMIDKFFMATAMLQEALEKLLQEYQPDCLVANMFFPWATDAAGKFGIPRLVFHGTGFFPQCTGACLSLNEPHKNVSPDSELFVVPNLPGDIKLTRNQLAEHKKQNAETDLAGFWKAVQDSELKSYGVVINSFYELEPDYADYYRNVLGWRAWHIGPVSLCNKDIEDKVQRGKETSIDEHQCLKWLDSKKPNSVIYICFGSIANFTATQLKEFAIGLEASGQQFIWVVRKGNKGEGEEEEWLPAAFEKRMEDKGLIIQGWAPQVLILDHEAIGGFVIHCGWNSTLEGIAAGKRIVTWPLFAAQFYNEKLVIHVLKIGVGVGVQEWVRSFGDSIKSEAVEKAVTQILVGEEAEEMRSRAKALGEMAVEEGGLSYSNLSALTVELRVRHH